MTRQEFSFLDQTNGHQVKRGAEIRVNWTAEEAWVWEERMSTSAPKTILSFLRQSSLPQRLAEALAQEVSATAGRALSETRVADLTKAERAALLQSLVSYPLNCTGHEGYPKVSPSLLCK